MQECWLNGVSTRKIENIAKGLGIESLSASEVSEINSGLDQMVDEFRTRRLDTEYPVIWADALYEKIRDNHSSVLCLRGTGQPELSPLNENLLSLFYWVSDNRFPFIGSNPSWIRQINLVV